MKLCSRCVAPETALNLSFDHAGVCSLCRTYDRIDPKILAPEMLRPLLEERFERFRGRSGYDAMVGLSGGKDSSYVALRLVKDYGLRVLLFTYDNGYLTDYARHNISLVVEKLGQDHIFLGPDSDVQRCIARSSVRRVGVPCIGCTFPGFVMVMKTAIERGIPFIVHGRSPAQMFKEIAPGSVDPFLPFIKGNLQPRDDQQVREFVLKSSRKLMKRLRWLVGADLNGDIAGKIQNSYCPDWAKAKSSAVVPEFLAFYLFEPYDENHIKQTLETRLQWVRPEDNRFMGHEDCTVHPVSVYLYTSIYGHPILQPELATLVRQGRLSREEALARLTAEKEKDACNEVSLQHLQNVTGMSRDEIFALNHRARSRLTLMRTSLKLLSPAMIPWLNRLLPAQFAIETCDWLWR
ncbi:MAG: hypothetical protein ACOYXC_10085 [Candidatus Rifleibacteriota bacterium]